MATLLQLARVCTARKLERLAPILGAYNEAVMLAEASARPREAAFLANIAVETGEFRYVEEVWGPTPTQLRYEGRVDLGNLEPGDGYRFRGRGWIELTGRKNYVRARDALGIPLVEHPELAALPEHAGVIAAWYWREHGCNEPADRLDLRGCRKIVNGGLNGIAACETYYARALSVLAA